MVHGVIRENFKTYKIILTMGNFKELRVWQEGVNLATDIYKMTRKEPFAKDFGLSSQIQRAVVSIASNIAEGDERGTNKESIYFFNVAKGSSAEVITQLNIAHNIGYIEKSTLEILEGRTRKINASLKKLIKVRT